jgi:rhodanese-related sulfurtransferase
MRMGIRSILQYTVIVTLSFVFSAAVIYLTPLKHLNVVEPSIETQRPIEFFEKYNQDPEAYIFIDVRSSESFSKVHAPGSINIPLHMLYDERHVLPRSEKTIALICSGNRASRVGYGYLEHYGFNNLVQIEGGIEQWKQEDLPVVTAQEE